MPDDRTTMMHLRRRLLLQRLAAGAALGAAAPLLRARPADAAARAAPRVLSFEHLHTGERATIAYHDGGAYLPDALAAVDRLLRDFRTGDVGSIDPQLLDLLHALNASTGTRRPFQIISGYRSPATNEALRKHGSGVASGSLHMAGQAIDIRLGDVPLKSLRDAALALQGGGVGYYPASDFVHVDTGRVRAW